MCLMFEDSENEDGAKEGRNSIEECQAADVSLPTASRQSTFTFKIIH